MLSPCQSEFTSPLRGRSHARKFPSPVPGRHSRPLRTPHAKRLLKLSTRLAFPDLLALPARIRRPNPVHEVEHHRDAGDDGAIHDKRGVRTQALDVHAEVAEKAKNNKA